MVGSFIDKKSSFHVVQHVAFRMWKKFGLKDVMLNDKGFIFFKFEDEEAMSDCLEAGPWLFQNKFILLQK